MATKIFNVCSCGSKPSNFRLFETLKKISESGPLITCPDCGAAMNVELNFQFALDGPHRCRVLDAFLPVVISEWEKESKNVKFYPFLVITVVSDVRSVWLPYWHVVTENGKNHKRYGQWAPFFDMKSFADLISQARSKGYQV